MVVASAIHDENLIERLLMFCVNANDRWQKRERKLYRFYKKNNSWLQSFFKLGNNESKPLTVENEETSREALLHAARQKISI